MNLFRFVDSMGYKPVLMGQIKGFLNRYRNPETQREFAREAPAEARDGGLVRRRLEAGARVGHHGQRHGLRAGRARHARPRSART